MAEEKYWVFDGKDAVGPFYADELKRQPLFGPESLICPDGSETADQWRPARYYLIKPPSAARPEPGRPASAAPEVGLPSVIPQRAPEPELPPIPWQKIGLVAAGVLAAAGTAYFAARKPRKAAAPASNSASNQSSEKIPQPVAAETVNQEAVDFVLRFPTQSAGPKLPGSPGDVLSVRKWKAPATVGDALELKSYHALAQAAGLILQKQGRTTEVGELDLRRHAERWDAYARRFLKNNYRLSWSTEFAGGGLYRVSAQARYRRDGPLELHSFEADLGRRTLRPVNLEAWFDVDPKGCARWGDKNIALGEPVDEVKMLAAVPAYPYPLPRRGPHKKPAAEAPAVAVKKKAPPKAAPKPSGPPAEEAEYPDEGAPADENPLVKATAEPPPKASPSLQTAPAPRKTPPAPDKAPAAPPTAPPSETAAKNKNASDMTVDELEKYLSRGAENKN